MKFIEEATMSLRIVNFFKISNIAEKIDKH